MIKISIDHRNISDALRKLSASMSDMSPAMQSIGEDLIENIRLGFRDSTDPWGNQWRKLSPVTIARRRKNSDKPLLDTGALRNSFTSQYSATSVVVGTRDPKARKHQFGVLPNRIPARPFMPIRDDQVSLPVGWQEDVSDTISHFINKSLRP